MNTGRQVYERNNRKKYLLFVGLLIVLSLFLVADVMTGPAMLPVLCYFPQGGGCVPRCFTASDRRAPGPSDRRSRGRRGSFPKAPS